MDAENATSYRSLSSHHIRLIDVNTDLLNDEIGTFEEFELRATPPFYALSHSWGTREAQTPFRIGKHTILVSQHLATGLRRLKELAVNTSVLSPPVNYLWIDTLCINQNDLAERSSQVQLMSNIYSRAIRTLVWLGPSFDTSSQAWQLLDTIYEIFRSQHPMSTSPEDIPLQIYNESFHLQIGLPEWSHIDWNSLRRLFELQWFSRIWVVQEVVLSTQDPILLHGTHIMQWHRMEWAASWLRRKGYLRLASLPKGLLHVDNIGYLRRAKVRWPLSALMSITQNKFRASDQHDKIYGLLGLAAEMHQASKLPEALVPDYSIDVREAYQRAARYFLETEGSLAILTRCNSTSQSLSQKRRRYHYEDFPTWLSNWSDFTVNDGDIRKSLSWLDHTSATQPARLGFPKHYSAAGSLALRVHDVEDKSTLCVDGICIDTVNYVTRMSDEDTRSSDFNASLATTIADVCKAALSLIGRTGLESWASHFIKVTTAEQQQLTGRKWEQCFKDGLAYLHQVFSNDQHLQSLMSAIDRASEPWLRDMSQGGEPAVYAALAGNFCYSRCFLITENGHMGIGPSASEIGDNVAVIPGGGVPYIIRRERDYWLFVGESYVHGVMSGEAIEDYLVGRIPMEELSFH
ncbi:HET domain-containing protein [Alternaria alternata]|jgi:hypothetical protein|nr:HET domain-containing protein [Alternaria alternata]OWY45165.1 HET domain protein [Alternaria alternata]